MKQFFALMLLLPMLVACASLDELKRVEPKGTPFSMALAQQYREFSQSEADQYDWWSSQYFAEKGLKAAYNQPVDPEQLEGWDLLKGMLPTLQDARKQLIAALNDKAKTEKPAVAAKAQFNFDCWVEQQEENWQLSDIASCRDEFYEALNTLTTPATAVKPVESKNTFTPSEDPAEKIATSYVVFFDLNSTAITREGDAVLNDVYNEISDDTEYEIQLDGHADLSGDMEYNKKLSEMRVVAVKNRLIQKGLTKGKITINAYGEDKPVVKTADGVKEKANRRVEIFINE